MKSSLATLDASGGVGEARGLRGLGGDEVRLDFGEESDMIK